MRRGISGNYPYGGCKTSTAFLTEAKSDATPGHHADNGCRNIRGPRYSYKLPGLTRVFVTRPVNTADLSSWTEATGETPFSFLTRLKINHLPPPPPPVARSFTHARNRIGGEDQLTTYGNYRCSTSVQLSGERSVRLKKIPNSNERWKLSVIMQFLLLPSHRFTNRIKDHFISRACCRITSTITDISNRIPPIPGKLEFSLLPLPLSLSSRPFRVIYAHVTRPLVNSIRRPDYWLSYWRVHTTRPRIISVFHFHEYLPHMHAAARAPTGEDVPTRRTKIVDVSYP